MIHGLSIHLAVLSAIMSREAALIRLVVAALFLIAAFAVLARTSRKSKDPRTASDFFVDRPPAGKPAAAPPRAANPWTKRCFCAAALISAWLCFRQSALSAAWTYDRFPGLLQIDLLANRAAAISAYLPLPVQDFDRIHSSRVGALACQCLVIIASFTMLGALLGTAWKRVTSSRLPGAVIFFLLAAGLANVMFLAPGKLRILRDQRNSRIISDASNGIFSMLLTDQNTARPEIRRRHDLLVLHHRLLGLSGWAAADQAIPRMAESAASLTRSPDWPVTQDRFFQSRQNLNRDPAALAKAEGDFTRLNSQWNEYLDLARPLDARHGDTGYAFYHPAKYALEEIGKALQVDRADLIVPEPEPSKPPPAPAPAPSDATTLALDGTEGVSIAAIGGFPPRWRMMLEPLARGPQRLGGPFKGQEQVRPFLRRGWDDLGMRVEGVAGDVSGWHVLMSANTPYSGAGQSVIYSLDRAELAKSQAEGLRITSMAGYADSWTLVLTKMPAWGDQQVSAMSGWNDGILEWLRGKVAAGYQITSVAGYDSPSSIKDGWIFVVTKNAGLGEQLFYGPSDWPAAAIHEKAAEGYRITSYSGFDNGTDTVWIVILSKTAGALQSTHPLGRDLEGEARALILHDPNR